MKGGVAVGLSAVMLGGCELIGDGLRAVPGPTEAWADIIGHLAWPVTALILIVCFREGIGRAVDLLASRFGSDDVETPLFKLSRKADNRPLAKGSPEGVAIAEMTDAMVAERLWEIADDSTGYDRIASWLTCDAGDDHDLDDFLTLDRHVMLRRKALIALEKGGG